VAAYAATSPQTTGFLNNIHMMEEMPEERKNCIVVPIYKKGDKQKVENHTGISLLNACYK